MKTNPIRLRGVLIAIALWLMLSALACGPVPQRYVSSYEKVQRAFNVDAAPGVVYPDLSVFNFDKSTMEYMMWPYIIGDRKSPMRDYTISGKGSIGENSITFVYTCRKDIYDCQRIDDPIIYNDTKIRMTPSENELSRCYSNSCAVFVNGYEYVVEAMYDYGKTLSESEHNALRDEIKDLLFSFICGIIDEAQAKV